MTTTANENLISTELSHESLDFHFLECDVYIIASAIRGEGRRLSCLLEIQCPPKTTIIKGINFTPHDRKDRAGLVYQLARDGRMPYIPWEKIVEAIADGVAQFADKQTLGDGWRTYALDHRDLLTKELPPLDFLVDTLLVTPSLAVLAGPKKRGKSWMALQLAQSVAVGAPFLGMATTSGSVIYMALEDGERRLRQRLEKQNAMLDLPITYVTRFQPINSKVGFDSLKELIQDKQPILLVIDTLAAIKDRHLDENEAGATADLFLSLHELALAANLVILLIAHHGKVSTGDAGFDIRGSSAIPGATDVNMGLYKNTDGTSVLRAEGRDIGEIDLRIYFDAEITWTWQCQGDERDMRRVEAENRIIEAIDLLGGDVEATTIANELEVSRGTVQTHLKRMRDAGLLDYKISQGKIKRILYNIPLTTPTSPTPTHGVGVLKDKNLEANHTHGVGVVRGVNNIPQNDSPPYPSHPCPRCGQNRWTMAPDAHYFCGHCRYLRPNPGEELRPCPCGNKDRWVTDDGRQLCTQCHPRPGGEE